MRAHISCLHMAGQFYDVDNLLSGRQGPGPAGLSDTTRQLESSSLLTGCVVEEDNSCMKVQVGLHGNCIAYVPRQPQALGKEHECTRQHIVELSVALPKWAEVYVVWAVARHRPMSMLHHLVEDVANNHVASIRGVVCALEYILEWGSRLFDAADECVLGCRQMGGDLRCVSYSYTYGLWSSKLAWFMSIIVGHPVLMLA